MIDIAPIATPTPIPALAPLLRLNGEDADVALEVVVIVGVNIVLAVLVDIGNVEVAAAVVVVADFGMTMKPDVLLPGDVSWYDQDGMARPKIEPKAQHLSCFAGGMVAVGAKVFERSEDLSVARRLVDGCIWAYESAPLGIMPEIIHTVACESQQDCPWDESKWHREIQNTFPENSAEETILSRHLAPGVSKIGDGRYILRPEAIESIFILYRTTGDPIYPEKAWTMFNNIIQHSITDIAHAGLNDCTVPNPPKQDRMESFWLAETLKYFYLMFSEPDVVSLDEYVLNTEAHPLRRPV